MVSEVLLPFFRPAPLRAPPLGLNSAPPCGRVYRTCLCEKKDRLFSLGHPKGIDRLTSRVDLRGLRFQGRKSRARRPDNPKGETRFFSLRQLPIYARPVPISLAGRSSRSAKSFPSSVVSG